MVCYLGHGAGREPPGIGRTGPRDDDSGHDVTIIRACVIPDSLVRGP